MDIPKRVIFSRKGFDGGTGCVPSPILTNGTMFSLPIPDGAGTVNYGDLSFEGHDYGKLLLDLKAKQIVKGRRKPLLPGDRVHLDPDLIPILRDRKSGWRPAYGQCGKDATILRQQQVGEGDLFLFFGWFRQCETIKGTYRYVSGAPHLHVIFGYLRVGKVVRLSFDPVPGWAADHPHLHGTKRKSDAGNTLFVAANALGLPQINHLPGAAAFTRFVPELQLTAEGMTRSLWRLPPWFYPLGRAPLSSHEKMQRWRIEETSCILQSVARGQEFVLDTAEYPEVTGWAANLIQSAMLQE